MALHEGCDIRAAGRTCLLAVGSPGGICTYVACEPRSRGPGRAPGREMPRRPITIADSSRPVPHLAADAAL
jgi:hypothetical protein